MNADVFPSGHLHHNDFKRAYNQCSVWKIPDYSTCSLGVVRLRTDPPKHSGARHPLLMARCLPPLPTLNIEDDAEFDSEYRGKVVPFQQPEDHDSTEMSDSDDEDSSAQRSQSLPRAIDLQVPVGKASVVITGPNTGVPCPASFPTPIPRRIACQ